MGRSPTHTSKTNKGISIYYFSVGSGHQMAAEALAEALRRENTGYAIRVTDPFANAIEILPPIMERLQSASIVLTPTIYDDLWRRGSSVVNLMDWITEFGLLQRLLIDELNKHNSKIIVATHVLPFALALALKNQTSLVHKVFGVVTDYGVHTMWPVKDIDGYFVAHEEVARTLVYRHADPHKVFITGIPIRLGFENPAENLSLPPSSELRILVVIGGVRSGAYVGQKRSLQDLLVALQEANLTGIRLTVVTGNQHRLRQEFDQWIDKLPFTLNVLGFVKDMYNLMANQDILITKPGGLTVSESLASGLGLILLRPSPGQETANEEFLARHGVALQGVNPLEAVQAIRFCLEHPEQLEQMKVRAKSLGKPDSAKNAAKMIVRLAAG
jgi:processive 1,2-diacylglycerol beta-glucosyltransferase